jgi:limonene 1,2-monooxygenase
MREIRNVRTGVFLPPHHANDEDVSLCMQRDFELVEWVEELGYSEVWMGEHHSGGMQFYGSPEMFVAAAVERTKRIKIGAGVISVPYHNPFMVADRIMQLDHQTRGRAMFGFGPGMLVADAAMLGIDPSQQRDRLVEGVDVIMRLIRGEFVTQESDWFTLRDAHLHLAPYSYPEPQFAIAASRTPVGTRLAGKYGFGVLTHGAGDVAGNWKVVEEAAAEYGTPVSRDGLRVVVNFHLAESRAQALKEMEFGVEPWIEYLGALNPKAYAEVRAQCGNDVGKFIDSRGALAGTPDDAVAFLDNLWDKTGGFGCLLLTGTNWMPFEATKRSYELMARYVLPKFKGSNQRRDKSVEWVHSKREEFSGKSAAAVEKALTAGAKT